MAKGERPRELYVKKEIERDLEIYMVGGERPREL